MPLTKSDVEKVAFLARLELSDEQVNQLTTQLSDIVGYMEKLNSIDTDGVEPQTQFISAENVFRDDVPRPCLPREEALRNAAAKTDEFFLAPKVIG